LRYFRDVLPRICSRYSATMSSGPTLKHIVCAQCEQTESHCQCEKFCVLCQSQLDIRLCTDGLLYCEACRTACDYKTAEK
jgi:hypothetical protein